MKYFVTGGAGFIGSRVVRQLVGLDAEVGVLMRPGQSDWRIRDIRDRVRVFSADLADARAITDCLREWHPTACIHAAWYAQPADYLESPRNLDSMRDSVALLQSLIAANCANILMIGSCAEYDTDVSRLTEDSPVRPCTLYAAAKAATHLVARQLATDAGVSLAWARVFHLFGPGENPLRMIPTLIQALLEGREFPATTGSQVRDYLHVDDAAVGLLAILGAGSSGSFNVCSGEPISVRELMTTVAEEIGAPELIRFGAVPYRDWEPPSICGDSSRLRQLGWRPKFDVRQAVRATIEYWRRSGSAAEEK